MYNPPTDSHPHNNAVTLCNVADKETRKWPSGTAGLLAQNSLLHITAATTLARSVSVCAEVDTRESQDRKVAGGASTSPQEPRGALEQRDSMKTLHSLNQTVPRNTLQRRILAR